MAHSVINLNFFTFPPRSNLITHLAMRDLIQLINKHTRTSTLKRLLPILAIGGGWTCIELLMIHAMQLFFSSAGLISYNVPAFLENVPHTPLISSIILICVGILRFIASICRQHTLTTAGQKLVLDFRSRILATALQNGRNVKHQEVLTTVFEGSGLAAYSFVSLATSVLCGLTASLLLLYCFIIAPMSVLLSLGICALYIPLRYLTRSISRYGDGIAGELNIASKTLLDGLKNFLFLRVLNQIDPQIHRGQEALKKYYQHYRRYSLLQAIAANIPTFLGVLVVCAVVLNSQSNLNGNGGLITFLYLFVRFSQLSSESLQSYSSIVLNSRHIFEVLAFLNKFNTPINNFAAEPEISNKISIDSIGTKDLSFGFQKDENLFEKLNLDLRKGDFLLIKGPSGVGKSTLISLLLGLEIPNNGQIVINDKPTVGIQSNLLSQVAYAAPEPFLIAGTLRDNLLLGLANESLTDQDIFDSCKNAHFSFGGFKQDDPIPLNFEISDSATLSTGQQQRLSLARAFLKNGKLLILDEATANLDFATEEKILKNIKTLYADRIVIAISHRDTYDAFATKTINLSPQ